MLLRILYYIDIIMTGFLSIPSKVKCCWYGIKSIPSRVVKTWRKFKGTSFEFKFGVFSLIGLVVISIGYISNIWKIATGFTGFEGMDGTMILRIIGIVVAPIGIVMGYIPA